jgi:hypothetical protein
MVPLELEGECIRRKLPYLIWKDTVPEKSGPIVVASYSDLVTIRNRLKQHRPLVLCEHGAGQTYDVSNPTYANGTGREGVALALVPGPWPAAAYRQASSHVRVVEVGLMKLDLLRERADGWLRDNRPTVAFSFHWATPGIPTLPELAAGWPYWMPAIQKLQDEHHGKLKILGHGHPRSWSHLQKLWEVMGVELVPTFAEVCSRSDLFVLDNSSSAFEFAAVTGKPILLLDHPSWPKQSNLGLRFGEAGRHFRHCGSSDNLEDAIYDALKYGLENKEIEQRERGLDLIYSPRSGGVELAVKALKTLQSQK